MYDAPLTRGFSAWRSGLLPSCALILMGAVLASPAAAQTAGLVQVRSGPDIVEGGNATFRIFAFPPTTTAVDVNLRVTSQHGNFVATEDLGVKVVRLEPGDTTTFVVPTVDDSVDEPDGTVDVTLLLGTGYVLGDNPDGQVHVMDNDGDTGAPSLSIWNVPPKINSTAVLDVRFAFTEDVTGFTTDDVTVTGGTKGGGWSTLPARDYQLSVTPTGSADVVVTVAANSVTAGVNTGPASAVTATATWDATAPAVTIGGVPSKINSTAALSVTFAFSEDVTGFAIGDVTVTGGAAGAFTAVSRTTYTLAVTPSGSADVTVAVAADAATDGAGNTGPASAVSETAVWDATDPNLNPILGVPAKINSRDTLTATFEFSEDVTGFTTDDVTVTGGTKGAFSGSGRVYTLAVAPSGSADVVVEVAADAATDGAGNTGPQATVTATATWDATAPTVEIGGVPAKINSRTVLTATFTFSEAVTGFAIGDVTVTGGAAGAFTAVSATVYTLAVTPADGSNVKVEVAANAATDGLNTGPASAVSATATWDAAAPTVEIGGVPAKINSRTVAWRAG